MKAITTLLSNLRPTFIIGAVCIIVLAVPLQVLELYIIETEIIRQLVSAGSFPLSTNILISFASAGALSVVLWLGSILLIISEGSKDASISARDRLLVALAATAPWIGLCVGLLNIKSIAALMQPNGPPEFATSVSWSIKFAIGFAFLIFAGLASITYLFESATLAASRMLFANTTGVIACLLIVSFTGGVVFFPVVVPGLFGTLAVILLFFIALAYLMVKSSLFFRGTGIPIISLSVFLGIVFSLLQLNDNHRVDYTLNSAPPEDILTSFPKWLQQRADREYFEKNKVPYPVYIIAAEGGGLYAAYHLAHYLARVQDACPTFAQHIFAISSVSGGSLGGAVFSSLTDRYAANSSWQGCKSPNNSFFQAFTREYFKTDFLSPLMAATLFPDMIQRVVPVPIRAFDRTRALEAAFESAWTKAARARGLGPGDNPFEQLLGKLWKPDHATPLLLLNTTGVETGSRVTLSPLKFSATATALHVSHAMCATRPKGIDLKLSVAVSLSARFPWIAPAGWLERPDQWVDECGGQKNAVARGNRLYLVDGGYFENSGLETALELRDRLRPIAPGAEIKIIAFFVSDDFANRWWKADGDLSTGGSGELLTPIKTLLNTRSARTRAVHSREAFFDANLTSRRDLYRVDGGEFEAPPDMHHVILDGTKSFLPIGWRLSPKTMEAIESNDSAFSQLTFELIQLELEAREAALKDTKQLSR